MKIAILLSLHLLSLAAPPIIIGHRGASGYRPEHTLESYALAIKMGADFIEPDLVQTKDGVLIARHENEISSTTNVATVFPDRKTTKVVDGEKITGWFSEDFTWDEIKKLRAKERLPFRSHEHDGKFAIPAFTEIVKFLKEQEKITGRKIGLYVEIKHPSYFKSIGLPQERKVRDALNASDLSPQSVFIECFETASLQWLKKNSNWPLVLLIEKDRLPYDLILKKDPRTIEQFLNNEGLREIRKYTTGIGPDKRLIVPANSQGKLQNPTDLIRRAHAAQLIVHPYTFRSDKEYLADAYHHDPQLEYLQFFKLGVDGLFSDFTDQAVQARNLFLQK